MDYRKAYETVWRLREKLKAQEQLHEELQAALATELMEALSHKRDSLQLRKAFYNALPAEVRMHPRNRDKHVPELFALLAKMQGSIQLDVCMALLDFLLPEESPKDDT